MPTTILADLREEWQDAWQSAWYRKRVLTGLVLVVTILSLFPLFFQRIELRHGYAMPDPLLAWLPPYNVSLAIFVIIWAISLLATVRAAQDPYMFLTFVWAYVLLLLFRTLTITVFALEPPVGLIGLVDPISNFFYGKNFVTKDLFFLCLMSSVFFFFVCLRGRRDRVLALLVTTLLGLLLLVQHVHYTLYVGGAFFFAWLSCCIVRRMWVRSGS